LTDYFAKHNPPKVASAGRLLSKYAGREMELFDKVYEKYGEPVLPLQAYAQGAQQPGAQRSSPQAQLPFNPLGNGGSGGPSEGLHPRMSSSSSPSSRLSPKPYQSPRHQSPRHQSPRHQSPGSLGSLSPTKSPTKRNVVAGGGPGQPAIFDKLQDHSQYTGAHRHRFDAATGQVSKQAA
jgi:hypothetical protein